MELGVVGAASVGGCPYIAPSGLKNDRGANLSEAPPASTPLGGV